MKAFLTVITFAGLIVSTFGATAHAETLTLDDCIDLALKNRASIIAARGAEDLAKADKRAALGVFLPRVSASYSYSRSYERDVEYGREFRGYINEPDDVEFFLDTFPFTDYRTGDNILYEVVRDTIIDSTFLDTVFVDVGDDNDRTNKSWGLRADMSLFDLSDWYSLAGAGAARERAKLDVIGSEHDLVYSVKMVYYAYLAMVENADVQEKAVKRSEEQMKLIQSKFDLGSAAKSDLLKQKVQYGKDRLALLSARNDVTKAKSDLAFTIGIDPNRDVEFSTEYTPRVYEGGLDQAIGYGMEHHPGYLASLKLSDAAGHELGAARASYLPTVTGQGSLYWSDGTQGDTATFNFSSRTMSIGLGVSWTIFDGFNRERRVAAAKVSRNNALAGSSEYRNMVTVEIRKSYLDMEKTHEQTKVAGETVDAATEDLNITQEKYNLGAATILDLLDAQVSLKQAQVELIQAGFDLNLAVARLDKAMGHSRY